MKRLVVWSCFGIVALMASSAAATTYHVAPDGSDGQSGRSSDSAWATFDYATAQLSPGDTLVLADGIYKPSRNDNLDIRCDHSNVSQGRADARITIRAAHERRAWIKGNGQAEAVRLIECKYWDLEGLHASGADVRGGSTAVVDLARSSHVRLRWLLVNDANGHTNSSAIGFQLSHHILVEDTEVYRFHRHGVSAYQSDHLTFRRVYVNARGAEDLGGYGSHNCCKHGGDEGFSFYFTSNSTVENSISIDSEQLSSIAGLETALGNPGGRNNQLIGTISLGDLRPSFTQSRNFDDRPYAGPADNIMFKNIVVIGNRETVPMSISGTQHFTLDGGTFLDSKLVPFNALTANRRVNGDRDFLGCSEVGGCDYDIKNAVFKNSAGSGELFRIPDDDALDFQLSHSNAWSKQNTGRGFGVGEDVADTSGQYRQSMQTKPTGVGLGQGQCAVFVPKSSNMSGAGADGGDMGANILYRYKNRELTDKPLWDPDSGQFPCGAIVEGINDIPGKSCFDVHKQLNVNQNGCQLPYGDTGPVEPPNKDVVLEAPRSSSTVAIDGELSEPIYSRMLSFDDARSASDNTTRVWAGWNDEWLYFGAEVDDPSVDIDPEANPWKNDSAEFFIDPNMDRGPTAPAADDFKTIMVADGAVDVASAPEGNWRTIDHNVKLTRKVVSTDTGYRVELAIGWTNLGMEPIVGDKLGLLVVNNDRDGDQFAHYAFHDGEPSSKPLTWGTLKLVDGATGPTKNHEDAGGGNDTSSEPDAANGTDAGQRSQTSTTGNSGCSAAGSSTVPAGWLSFLLSWGAFSLCRRRKSWGTLLSNS